MNPLFQKQMTKQKAIDPKVFKEKLMKVDDKFLAQMEEQARKQGISEEDIMAGKQYLNLMRGGQTR